MIHDIQRPCEEKDEATLKSPSRIRRRVEDDDSLPSFDTVQSAGISWYDCSTVLCRFILHINLTNIKFDSSFPLYEHAHLGIDPPGLCIVFTLMMMYQPLSSIDTSITTHTTHNLHYIPKLTRNISAMYIEIIFSNICYISCFSGSSSAIFRSSPLTPTRRQIVMSLLVSSPGHRSTPSRDIHRYLYFDVE